MVKTIGVIAAALVLSLRVGAQKPSGSSTSTYNGDSVSITFVRARYGHGGGTQEALKAVVVFVGRSGWTGALQNEGGRLRAREDSVKLSTPARLVTGGVVTDRVSARVLYDPEAGQLSVGRHRADVGSVDSTLIVIVSGADTEEPVVSLTRVRAPAVVATGASVVLSPELPPEWWAMLDSEPRTREYAKAVYRP